MALRGSVPSNRKRKEEIKVVEKDEAGELAMKMIEKEHELERKLDAKVIDDLITIYSQAIEYYSQKNDLKYLDLQNRMHKILMKPEVLQFLKHESSKPKNKDAPDLTPQAPSPTTLTLPPSSPINSSEQSHIQIVPLKISPTPLEIKTEPSTPVFNPSESPPDASHEDNMKLRRQKSEITKRSFVEKSLIAKASSPQPRGRNLKIMIDRHTTNNKTTASRATADFKSQENALERRLASRKKLQLTRSMSFTSYEQSGMLDDSFKCELSDLEEDCSTKDSCFVIEETVEEHCEKYEKMLEEIMEKNFGERALKTAEVKHKYEVQIEEIRGMGDMMQMLVGQMKKNMQEEIDKIVEEYDMKRKEEIAQLRIYYV